MHYFKFNIPSWSLSTAHLSLEEDGVYFRLVCHYYDTEQPIPLDTDSVIRRLRLGSHAETVLKILAEFFTRTESGFVNQYCERLIEKYHAGAKKNKKNGKGGGRPKKNKDLAGDKNKPIGLPDETDSQPNGNLNHKPITNNQEPQTRIVSAKAQKPLLDYSCWPSEADPSVLADWLAMRKRMKADVSQTVINQFAPQLREAGRNGYSVTYCISECITRNWRGFRADWILKDVQHHGNSFNKQELIEQGNAAVAQRWANGAEK